MTFTEMRRVIRDLILAISEDKGDIPILLEEDRVIHILPVVGLAISNSLAADLDFPSFHSVREENKVPEAGRFPSAVLVVRNHSYSVSTTFSRLFLVGVHLMAQEAVPVHGMVLEDTLQASRR